jgi:hypothetical protein
MRRTLKRAEIIQQSTAVDRQAEAELFPEFFGEMAAENHVLGRLVVSGADFTNCRIQHFFPKKVYTALDPPLRK